ncbi:pyridoxal phosphate-dependent aminotransferase [Paenibacillus sp. LS1]|uniref:MalY/PatB family protein n=1 Tax=Paenibacillus sp. LS1 TaxID=2992120 RepID=UPI00222EB396|nr:MalY/PatB family protein [Paenibacillus sp. LS1]MCW3791224.1 pyridoxal phosphate-dependent aminotransferase [Paenibacillus sp. LS1]
MKYDFDEIIDRTGTNAMNTDGFRQYIFNATEDMTFPFKDEEFIRMWIADMEFATPPEILDAVKERLDRRIMGYSQVFDPAYYEAVSNWMKRYYDWSFPKEHLETSNGIIPALYELVEYICQSDEKVLIVTPSYGFFKSAAEHNNLELVCSDMINEQGRYSIDFEDFEAKAKDEKVRVCIFCNPHNPSGRVWTTDELQRVGEICLRNNVWVISDEIHCDLLRTGKRHTPLAKLFPDTDRIITCMSPSKTFNMAGLMFSNVIIPNKELRDIWQARHYGFKNPLSIAATQAAYETGDEWLKQLKGYLDANFAYVEQYVKQYLPLAIFHIPDATYLAWIDISAYAPEHVSLPLFFAEQAGVLLEDGHMFVANGAGCIRLNLACPRSVLQEGLRRISSVLVKEVEEVPVQV